MKPSDTIAKVLGILHRMTGKPWRPPLEDEPVGMASSRKLLERHTDELLGAPPAERAVRIMMDVGGPKLRTGALPAGAPVLKLRPLRDEFGRVVMPCRVGLRANGASTPVSGASAHAGVDAAWLAQLELGDHIDLTDARGAKRSLQVVLREEAGILAECTRTAYLVADTRLKRRRKGARRRSSAVSDLPCAEGILHLMRGEILHLTRDANRPPVFKSKKQQQPVAAVACTLPEIFKDVCVGERVWFDDGRIGGVIRRIEKNCLEIEITHARDCGEKLASDKGINLPDKANASGSYCLRNSGAADSCRHQRLV